MRWRIWTGCRTQALQTAWMQVPYCNHESLVKVVQTTVAVSAGHLEKSPALSRQSAISLSGTQRSGTPKKGHERMRLNLFNSVFPLKNLFKKPIQFNPVFSLKNLFNSAFYLEKPVQFCMPPKKAYSMRYSTQKTYSTLYSP